MIIFRHPWHSRKIPQHQQRLLTGVAMDTRFPPWLQAVVTPPERIALPGRGGTASVKLSEKEIPAPGRGNARSLITNAAGRPCASIRRSR